MTIPPFPEDLLGSRGILPSILLKFFKFSVVNARAICSNIKKICAVSHSAFIFVV
jgi:hypothetical protein